jgi:uncharacterized protein YjbI with pentapeptide repeats
MLKTKDRGDTRTLDIHGAFVRRADLSGASLRRANMTGADATNAIFRDADFEGALLDGTILRGADLTGAKNLTVEQLSKAILDERTVLPDYIDRAKIPEATESKSGRR